MCTENQTSRSKNTSLIPTSCILMKRGSTTPLAHLSTSFEDSPSLNHTVYHRSQQFANERVKEWKRKTTANQRKYINAQRLIYYSLITRPTHQSIDGCNLSLEIDQPIELNAKTSEEMKFLIKERTNEENPQAKREPILIFLSYAIFLNKKRVLSNVFNILLKLL